MSQFINNSDEIALKPSTTLDSFIHVFDDMMPEAVCDQIIQEYGNCHDWSKALIADGQKVDLQNSNIRDCDEIAISDYSIISKNEFERKNIDNLVFQSISKILHEYKKIHGELVIEIDTGYRLLRYNEGQFFSEHTDSYREEQRSLSCSIQLNENYDGGEFSFFGREIMIRSKKGSVIVFPSNFMYPHEIMPVIKGTRYSIITWLV